MPKLTVVCVLFNPVRYKIRWKLFGDFVKHMLDSGVNLIVVECAFGERPWLFTEKGNWQHIQVRTWDELWIKENLYNLGIQRAETDYIATIDADIHFSHPNWALETVEALQHYAVIQPWTSAITLSPTGTPLTAHTSWCFDYLSHVSVYPPGLPVIRTLPYERCHPGLAWAWRREAIDGVGGLLDFDILGGGDFHMSRCLVGRHEEAFHDRVTQGYKDMAKRWQDRALTSVKKNIGYCNGTILHNWHGKFVNRKYEDKWCIAINHRYDPHIHVAYDSQGLLRWTSAATPEFKADLRSYFRVRNEDGIDI